MAKDREEFLKFLKESNEKFMDAYNTRNYGAVQGVYAPDARLMPPNRPMFSVKGIPDFVKTIVSLGHHKFRLLTQEVFGPFAGEAAIERAIFEFDTKEGLRKYNIKALRFWKKIDGQWRIQCQCWNFDHAEAMA